MSIRFLVLQGDGINCDNDVAFSIRKAGAEAELMHINRLIEEPKALLSFDALIIPGGFSFGDLLGSGQIMSLKMKKFLKVELEKFVAQKKPILGICNGFQVLVRLGLLPTPQFINQVSLIENESGYFQDQWVDMHVNAKSPCVWTKNLPQKIDLPIRHGEGRLFVEDEKIKKMILEQQLIPLQYVNDVNGAFAQAAALCDSTGLVMGMMPHPEAAITGELMPTTSVQPVGLEFFKNAISYLQGGLK